MSDVLPRIIIPPLSKVMPDEIERRHRLFREVMRLREQMPALGFDAAELIREVREEERSLHD